MISTHLILTQTSLDILKIQQIIATNYFANSKINFEANIATDEELLSTWEKYRNSGQIILFEPKEKPSSIEQFSIFVSSNLNQTFSRPTLLFLGDLSALSSNLQEATLKLLEEPPKNLKIIITAQNKSEIKNTIISRSLVQTIPIKIVLTCIDPKLKEKIKKLPEPTPAANNLMRGLKIEVEKPADYEREELDLWLWMIQTNLEFMYKASAQSAISLAIQKVLTARQLNDQNSQKKFAIGWLNT